MISDLKIRVNRLNHSAIMPKILKNRKNWHTSNSVLRITNFKVLAVLSIQNVFNNLFWFNNINISLRTYGKCTQILCCIKKVVSARNHGWAQRKNTKYYFEFNLQRARSNLLIKLHFKINLSLCNINNDDYNNLSYMFWITSVWQDSLLLNILTFRYHDIS